PYIATCGRPRECGCCSTSWSRRSPATAASCAAHDRRTPSRCSQSVGCQHSWRGERCARRWGAQDLRRVVERGEQARRSAAPACGTITAMILELPRLDPDDWRSYELLQRVLDTLPDPVFVKDRAHR